MIVSNPIMGGGLSLSKLQAATAAPEDVLAGKKFYSGSKALEIGTRSSGTLQMLSGEVYINYGSSSLTVSANFAAKFIFAYSSYSQLMEGYSGSSHICPCCIKTENVTLSNLGLSASLSADKKTVTFNNADPGYRLGYWIFGE